MAALYCNSPQGACVQPDWCVNKGACAYSAVTATASWCRAPGGICANADRCIRRGGCTWACVPDPAGVQQ